MEFYQEFLQEGKAELFLDENQLPVLRTLINDGIHRIRLVYFSGPVHKDDSQMTMNQTNLNSQSSQIQSITQLILSLDMDQWENLVEVFHIENCMIDPENVKLF